MNSFAKLFDTERGQVVALRHQDSDGSPAVVFMFDPGVDGLALCSIALAFDDNELGEEKRDAAFDAITEETAKKVAFQHIDGIRNMWGATSSRETQR